MQVYKCKTKAWRQFNTAVSSSHIIKCFISLIPGCPSTHCACDDGGLRFPLGDLWTRKLPTSCLVPCGWFCAHAQAAPPPKIDTNLCKTMSWAPASLVFSVAFLCYLSSLDCGFVFDDHRGILKNDDLASEKTSLFEVFQHDFWGGPMSRKESHKSYRPLTVLSYRYLNYYFYQLEPYSYHLVNVVLHCTASVLFLIVCQNFLTDHTTKQQKSIFESFKANMWPTIAALLFAVHSIHTEAVSRTCNVIESI